jgi:hypothetical protein
VQNALKKIYFIPQRRGKVVIMKNYKETLEKLIEGGATVEQIKAKINEVNKAVYTEHCKSIALDKKPLETLYKDNFCEVYGLDEKNRILVTREKKAKAIDVEKHYRLVNSKATNATGKALPNNDITIFVDFKVNCALHSFIKKCNNEITKEVYTFDKKVYTDKVVTLDFSNIMDSKTALDKAINNILVLVGIDATYKKKYNDSLKHFATNQRVNAKGITISDRTIYDLMDYIIDCCKDRVTVKLSYMQEKKDK